MEAASKAANAFLDIPGIERVVADFDFGLAGIVRVVETRKDEKE